MDKIKEALFGAPPKTPEEQAKAWKRQMQAEGRKLDRQVQKIRREEQKAVMAAKKAAKENDLPSVRILSKEILQTRKTVKRLITARTHLNSVAMQLQMQAAQAKVVGALQRSTEVMRSMNALVKVNEVSQVMMGMSREMTKAGVIEEMVEETLDNSDVSEGEMDEEVKKVVEEVVKGQMVGTHVANGKLPEAERHEEEAPVAEDEDDDELMAKYNALKAA